MIRIGVNSDKTHPAAYREYKNGWAACLHAEMDVLRFARPGDTLEVLRISADGIAMAKPCKFCQKMIEEKGIRKVRYTDPNGEWQSFKVSRSN